MNKPTVSVIMSVYNESSDELMRSINSIISQKYTDFEFIIVNDNPGKNEIENVLSTINDKRIKLYSNKKNCGLVYSLNKAIELAQGKYIARMDADDISYTTRLSDELKYMKEQKLDMLGAYIELIDENNQTIKSVMRFPVTNARIKIFMHWGSCISHPTWLVKKSLYMELKGYRNAQHCEDYDFLLRAIASGYRVGNIPKVELKYRVRQSGVSKSNEIEQYLLREYLSTNIQKINAITEEDITNYLHSEIFQLERKHLLQYKQNKEKLKNAIFLKRGESLIKMTMSKYFWKDLLEKTTLLAREL